MAYEAVIYDKEGRAVGDMRAILDRGWLLNGYEECTFNISAAKELERLGDFEFGNYLVVTDDELPIWGGYFDPNRSWSTRRVVTLSAYSGEKLFESRCFPGERLLKGTAGVIYRQIIETMNNILPWPTLVRPGSIYDGGKSREEAISAKRLYDDVVRIAERSENDWQVEPVVQNGQLHFNAHWYAWRGQVKDFALEEGVNVEAKDNVFEEQGEIWNYIWAYGNGSTWGERAKAVAYDMSSIERYGVRMYGLAVDANDVATVTAHAEAFRAVYAKPRRTFNLTIGGRRVNEDDKSTVFKTLRIGDVVDLALYSAGYENGQLGIETRVRVIGMVHRGKRNVMDLTAVEVI